MRDEIDALSEVGINGRVAVDPYGIYPYHMRRRLWEYLMYFLSVICFWEMPIEWFFNPPRPFVYILPSLFIDVIYFIDIFVVLRTGVFKAGVVKLDKVSIRASIKNWRLIVYWVSPWPYYLIGWFVDNDIMFRVLVSLKLLRLFRLYDARKVIRETLIYMNPISRMATLACRILTVDHFLACLFWYVGHNGVSGESWLTVLKLSAKPVLIQYLHTLYYVTTTMFTLGYGDLHPCTLPEVCVSILIEMTGVFTYNFVVSNFVSIVANLSRTSFLSKYQRIYSAFKWRGVSRESMDELLKYYEYVWERDRDRARFYRTASELPSGLQRKLALALHLEVFRKVDALAHAGRDALEAVAMALRPRIYAPGDVLVIEGRVSSGMFFVTEGKIGIVNSAGRIIASIDGVAGGVLGEASVLRGHEEQASAVAETYLEAFELTKEDFEQIVRSYPEIQMAMLANL